MRNTRLNLTAIRSGLLPRPHHPRTTPGKSGEPGSVELSRREVLGLAGSAAVCASPVMKAIDTTLRGRFECIERRNSVAFKLGGREMWTIDTRRFAGSPVLDVQKSADLITVSLSNARYPGTDLPADLTCELRPAVVGWRMKLKLALGGFKADVPFERWLIGAEHARCQVKLDTKVCDFSLGQGLTVSGKAEAEYRPDSTLRLRGAEIACVTLAGGAVVSDSFALSLLKPEDASMVAKPYAGRTLITMDRGKRAWPLESMLLAPEGWIYTADGRVFDVLSIEAAENETGAARRALFAESIGDEANLCLQPLTDWGGKGGEPLSVPLRNVRCAVAFGPSEQHSAVVARFGSDPVWLHADGCSLQLGDSPHAPDFEVSGRNGKAQNASCFPALLAIVAPLVGAITEPARPESGALVQLAATGTRVQARQRPIVVAPPAASPPAANPPARTAPPADPPAAKAPATLRPGVKVIEPEPGARVVRPEPDAKVIRAEPPRTAAKRPEQKPPTVKIPTDFSVSVVRPTDLLVLKFEFRNLSFQSGGASRLIRANTSKPAHIIVHFPPQNIAERAFFQDPGGATTENPGTKPVDTMISGPSRLVFKVPDKTTEIPYTLDALLDWKQFEPSLAPTAQPPSDYHQPRTDVMSPSTAPLELNPHIFDVKTQTRLAVSRVSGGLSTHKLAKASVQSAVETVKLSRAAASVSGSLLAIRKPLDTETSLEVPYRLMMSPHVGEGWAHSSDAVMHGGKAELWHTRMGMKRADGSVNEADSPARTLRAIWSPDYTPDNPPNHDDWGAFRNGLKRWWRYEIVDLTSNFRVKGYEPLPVHAEQFMLTSMGAWLKSRGNWDPRPLNESLSEWRHVATMGRDHYVKAVEIGFLYPFGHFAVRTTVTERKFEDCGSKGMGAYMRQRVFVTVLRPVVEYPFTGAPDIWKSLPFRKIRCATEVTPDLADPVYSKVPKVSSDAFWPVSMNELFAFQMIGEDWDGRHIDFTAPAIFVTFDVAFNWEYMKAVKDEYSNNGPCINKKYSSTDSSWRTRDMKSQKIAYAESDKPSDTTYETVDMMLDGDIMKSIWTGNAALQQQLKDEYQPPFYPMLAKSNVKVAAIQHLVGTSSPATMEYHQAYKTDGFAGANKGEVFAKITSAADLKFGGSPDKSCGVAAPDMSIGGLSRVLGPVGGAADSIANGHFDPMSFFADAMVLGTIPLSSIIKEIKNFSTEDMLSPKFPKLTSKPIYASGSSTPRAIESSLVWETSDIQNSLGDVFVAKTDNGHCSLALSATKTTALDGGPSSHVIRGELKNFTVQLLPGTFHLMDVIFNSLKFTAESGKKADVKADVAKMKFCGPLAFINKLEEILGGNNFSDPPFLEVTTSHVRAGYTQPIPIIGIGVFSLANINLEAALTVPFIGDPISMRFEFCKLENPFMLTVSMFGGGGYFAIELNSKGVQRVEGSLEFGGSFALGLGVASGAVYVTAGVSYAKDMITGGTELGGHLRCGGILEVLGIITVSLTFFMELKHYDTPTSRLHGIATLTVEIEILFFSTSVDLTVEREFGGGGDPGFKDLMDEGDWSEYCNAFAA